MQWTNTRLPNGVDNLLKVQNSAGETYFFSGGEESVAKMFFFSADYPQIVRILPRRPNSMAPLPLEL